MSCPLISPLLPILQPHLWTFGPCTCCPLSVVQPLHMSVPWLFIYLAYYFSGLGLDSFSQCGLFQQPYLKKQCNCFLLPHLPAIISLFPPQYLIIYSVLVYLVVFLLIICFLHQTISSTRADDLFFLFTSTFPTPNTDWFIVGVQYIFVD